MADTSVTTGSDAIEIRLAMEMVKTLRTDFSRSGFLRSVLPELLGMLGGTSGGLVTQRTGAWEREIWVGEEVRIPELLMLYRNGKLKLDELITKRYSLDHINEGYQDMRDGKNIRGILDFT